MSSPGEATCRYLPQYRFAAICTHKRSSVSTSPGAPHPCNLPFPCTTNTCRPLLLPFPSFVLPSSNPLHCVFSSRNKCKHHIPTDELCLVSFLNTSRSSRSAFRRPSCSATRPHRLRRTLRHRLDLLVLERLVTITLLQSAHGPPFGSHSYFVVCWLTPAGHQC